MSFPRRPTLPMPTKAEILELVTFLAANVSVFEEDGFPEKAERARALMHTAQALSERAVDLSEVRRISVVVDGGGRAYESYAAYRDGCVIDVQDDGLTLKLLPSPKLGSFL
jgi:hypothetical protein